MRISSLSKALQLTVAHISTVIPAYQNINLKCHPQDDKHGIQMDHSVYTSLLRNYGNMKALSDGKRIHNQILQKGLENDIYLANMLLQMYGKCGALEEANAVFARMHQRDHFSWNFMIRANALNGQGKDALRLLDQMQCEGINSDKFIYVSILSACASPAVPAEGKRMHARIVGCGFESDVAVGNALISMYGNCASPADAHSVFDEMSEKDIISWNAFIAVSAQYGHAKDTLQLFNRMLTDGVVPDKITFISMLSVCGSPASASAGKQMHARIVGSGSDINLVIWNALLNLYSKCGSHDDACIIFEMMNERDVVSWTSMIASYCQHKQGKGALKLFGRMQDEGVLPNKVTVISILSACSSQATLAEMKRLHAQVVSCGFQSDIVVGNVLVNNYGKCGRLDDALRIFTTMQNRDVFSWNAMIAAYAQHDKFECALQLFDPMQREGVMPDNVTFVSILSACAGLATLCQGKQMHARIVGTKFESDVIVGTSLVHMYGECGSAEDAKRMFDQMSTRNTHSWTTMIAVYAKHGHGKDALQLYSQMQKEKIVPDKFTFVSVLSACSSQAALVEGKRMHAHILGTTFEKEVVLGNALINMYSKCGKVVDARRIFDKMFERDAVSWSAIIASYSQYGKGKDSLQLFREMIVEGFIPDKVTYVSVLAACSHGGLLEEGCRCFFSMEKDHGITPVVDHYNCMIDLLGRAGRLNEAEDLLKKMPCEPTVVSWMTLLSACRTQVDVERGKFAAERVMELDPSDPTPYVTLSNIYAAAGRASDAARLMDIIRLKGLKKHEGRSSIEVKGVVHEFVTNDELHLQKQEIYAEWEQLSRQMMNAGYMPEMTSLDSFEGIQCIHSEMLAIAFGLISTPPRTPLLITTTSKVCHDCHSATKFLSKMVHREIVVRDTNRFHNVKDGVCSCADHW